MEHRERFDRHAGPDAPCSITPDPRVPSWWCVMDYGADDVCCRRRVALPDWARGRGLAVFLTFIFGATIVGSAISGKLSAMEGMPIAYFGAAAGARVHATRISRTLRSTISFASVASTMSATETPGPRSLRTRPRPSARSPPAR